jgi:hypothetical protein
MSLFRLFVLGVGAVLVITVLLYTFCMPHVPRYPDHLSRSSSFAHLHSSHLRFEEHIPDEHMLGMVKSATELRKRTEGFRRHAFNVLISDRIGLHRSLPDVRPEGCQDKVYDRTEDKVSVIICFHNEAPSTLMRSIHSIFDRTDSQLIQEILLINDCSTGSSSIHFRSFLCSILIEVECFKLNFSRRRNETDRGRSRQVNRSKCPFDTFTRTIRLNTSSNVRSSSGERIGTYVLGFAC